MAWATPLPDACACASTCAVAVPPLKPVEPALACAEACKGGASHREGWRL